MQDDGRGHRRTGSRRDGEMPIGSHAANACCQQQANPDQDAACVRFFGRFICRPAQSREGTSLVVGLPLDELVQPMGLRALRLIGRRPASHPPSGVAALQNWPLKGRQTIHPEVRTP